ncbi:alpha/beta hydrolase family protein [Mucilaginibacter segetis]|uniref:Alpha/beta fold hydrolase n=1 Tax=Mucilaginibacter segetis TaxID=2793071 RepID=A0A934UKT5_9SPHI|nr:alpha/beta fold hydrolase [Mucilaginibacter segetis]MBK0377798.1 alpha/beta fold hydrolase [Mucilaginibacter segetis]
MITKDHYTIPGAKGRGMAADITYDDNMRRAPLVIFAHGFKGFKDWGTHNLVANYFAENGFRFLKFNFSHNGTTADSPVDFADLIAFSDNTFSIELDDLTSVIDFACGGSGIAAADDVYLIGHSMGGGISIIKTAEDSRIKKLVTMASISDFHNLWPKQAEEQWRLQGVMYIPNKRTGQQMPLKASLLDDLSNHPIRLNIQAKAAQTIQPWLLMHGDADPTVPLSHALELKAAQPAAQFVMLPGGDHTFGGSHPYMENTLPATLLKFCDDTIAFLKK